jgi:hypothetical protein
MKYATLLGLASASKINSACTAAGVNGVVCGPDNEELFAVGMNGDEDLGQDIIMKGNKFHYGQEVPGSEMPAQSMA